MTDGWQVKKDGVLMASGPMSTMYPDAVVRSMIRAGYKVYVDGKIYKPGKKKTEEE